MYWIDTHVHLSHERFKKSRDEVVNKMISGNCPIEKIVEVPISFEDNLRMRDTMKQYQNKIRAIGYAAGIHPLKVSNLRIQDYYDKLIKFCKDPETVAIGETGLDWYRVNAEETEKRQTQLEWFQLFSWMAQKLDLPLILHIRGDGAPAAACELLRLTSKEGCYRGVLHSCSINKEEEIEQFLNLGFHIGISGATLREEHALSTILNVTPRNRLLLETDSPYLNPTRGGCNTPENLEIIAQKVCTELGEPSVEKLRNEITENANALFWRKTTRE